MKNLLFILSVLVFSCGFRAAAGGEGIPAPPAAQVEQRPAPAVPAAAKAPADFPATAKARADAITKSLAKAGVDTSKYKTVLDEKHGFVYVSARSDADFVAIRAELEGYADFQWKTLFKRDPASVIGIVLLSNEDLKRMWHGYSGWAAGDDLYAGDDPNAAAAHINVAIHEFTHILQGMDMRVRGAGSGPAPWFSEGLAVLFESSKRVGDEWVPQDNMVRRKYLVTGQTLPWEQIMTKSITAYLFNVQLVYSQGGYMMFYMYQNGVLKDFYGRYMDNLRAGKPDAGKNAVEAAFGQPLADVEGDWRTWVMNPVPFPPDKRLAFRKPATIFIGKEFRLPNIHFAAAKPDGKVTGTLFWRKKGETKFEALPVEPAGKERYKAALPGSVTKEPFEYYVEMQEAGEKPLCEPEQGAQTPILVTPVPEPKLPFLGVSPANQNGQVVVRAVAPNSAAAKAGMQAGDVITAINGTAVHTTAEENAAVAKTKVGEEITIDVLRGGQKLTLKVTMGQR